MPEESPIRILVCAGETSGDMYGAAILRELRAIAQATCRDAAARSRFGRALRSL